MTIYNPTTASVTSVASSAASVTLFVVNPAARGRSVFNDSTSVLFVKFGATATTSSYTAQISAGGFFPFPGPAVYCGQVDGIWASANGAARVTEQA